MFHFQYPKRKTALDEELRMWLGFQISYFLLVVLKFPRWFSRQQGYRRSGTRRAGHPSHRTGARCHSQARLQRIFLDAYSLY